MSGSSDASVADEVERAARESGARLLVLVPTMQNPMNTVMGEARRRQIARLAGPTWTDHNSHDPGITILEQLCFALTDLGYRTHHALEDLVAEAEREDEEAATPSEPASAEADPEPVEESYESFDDLMAEAEAEAEDEDIVPAPSPEQELEAAEEGPEVFEAEFLDPVDAEPQAEVRTKPEPDPERAPEPEPVPRKTAGESPSTGKKKRRKRISFV